MQFDTLEMQKHMTWPPSPLQMMGRLLMSAFALPLRGLSAAVIISSSLLLSLMFRLQMVEERCGLVVLTWAAREDVVITRWLMLCDALTFPVGLLACRFYPHSFRQESPKGGLSFCLQMSCFFELQKGAGTCLRVQGEIQI